MGWRVNPSVLIREHSDVRTTLDQESSRGPHEALLSLCHVPVEWIVAIAALFVRERSSSEHDIRTGTTRI
jgi:hypothetical protein